MWATRTNASSAKADGHAQQRCNCLWLGAGGSGKTWAYTQVLRPLFRHFFGEVGLLAGAAAVRLLGPEARMLHKLANVSPNAGLDRRSLRAQKGKIDALEQRIVSASAAASRQNIELRFSYVALPMSSFVCCLLRSLRCA